MEIDKKGIGSIELAVAMLLSGSIGVFVIKSGQSPGNVVFFRCATAFALLIPYCVLSGVFKKQHLNFKSLLTILLSGVLMITNWVLLFKAFALTSMSWATIVYHINPFLVIIGGAVFLRQPISREGVLWTCVAFVGLLLVSNVLSDTQGVARSELMGLILVLVASSMYAGTILLTKKLANVPPTLIVCLQTGIGTVLLAPFLDTNHLPVNTSQWADVITLGVVHTFILYWLVFSAYQKLDVTTIAVMSFIYPVSAAVLDYLVFGHVFTVMQVVGGVIILLSTLALKLNWRLFAKRPEKVRTPL